MTENINPKTNHCYFKKKFLLISHPEHFLNTRFTVGHFILFILLFSFVVWLGVSMIKTTRVDGDSMFPTLNSEEFLLIKKYLPFESPKRGDIISSLLDKDHNKSDGKTTVVKRVIGLPGEIVEFKNRRFTIINPELGYIKFKENYLIDPNLTPSWSGDTTVRFYVPKNQYFVLGDNREISEDSRDYGTILKKNIIGKVFAKIPSVYFIDEHKYNIESQAISEVIKKKMMDSIKNNEDINSIEVDNPAKTFIDSEEIYTVEYDYSLGVSDISNSETE